jgi:hypothetical protein
VRRGYPAAFFLGNEPGYDLLCVGETDFRVQVKGFSCNKPKSKTAKGNYVPIKNLRTGNRSDLIIIVRVPKPLDCAVAKPSDPFEFFIATLGDLRKAQPEEIINPKTGKPYEPFTPGVSYRNFERFQDRWDLLPAPPAVLTVPAPISN